MIESLYWFALCCSYKWEAIDKDNNVKYTLKLCDSSPSTSCGSFAAVCAQNLSSSSSWSVGEYSKSSDNNSEFRRNSENNKERWLNYEETLKDVSDVSTTLNLGMCVSSGWLNQYKYVDFSTKIIIIIWVFWPDGVAGVSYSPLCPPQFLSLSEQWHSSNIYVFWCSVTSQFLSSVLWHPRNSTFHASSGARRRKTSIVTVLFWMFIGVFSHSKPTSSSSHVLKSCDWCM